MYELVLAFITSFGLTYFAIPSIIHIAIQKKLVEIPDERRSHTIPTPALGGIAIFLGIMFSIILWTPFTDFGVLQYILCSFIIMFVVGVKDDIMPMSPYKKLVGELAAAAIVVFKSSVKLTSLYGIFGVQDIPEWFAIPLSIFTIIVIINAFNLIDGINGLSGSIAVLFSVSLGLWFFFTGNTVLAILAAATAGATIAFLKFNVTPAKIFMGDTGALLLGLIASIFSISFIEAHKTLTNNPYAFKSAPAIMISIMILPLFDTLRVFTVRILKGKSPFYPDRTHIHHMLIDAGFTHMKATGLLIVTNILFMIMTFSLQGIGTLNLLLVILFVAILLTYILRAYSLRQKQLTQ